MSNGNNQSRKANKDQEKDSEKASDKVSLKDCAAAGKGRDPLTNRCIKIDSDRYGYLAAAGLVDKEMFKRLQKCTPAKDGSVRVRNPLTGRCIKEGGPLFMKLIALDIIVKSPEELIRSIRRFLKTKNLRTQEFLTASALEDQKKTFEILKMTEEAVEEFLESNTLDTLPILMTQFQKVVLALKTVIKEVEERLLKMEQKRALLVAAKEELEKKENADVPFKQVKREMKQNLQENVTEMLGGGKKGKGGKKKGKKPSTFLSPTVLGKEVTTKSDGDSVESREETISNLNAQIGTLDANIPVVKAQLDELRADLSTLESGINSVSSSASGGLLTTGDLGATQVNSTKVVATAENIHEDANKRVEGSLKEADRLVRSLKLLKQREEEIKEKEKKEKEKKREKERKEREKEEKKRAEEREAADRAAEAAKEEGRAEGRAEAKKEQRQEGKDLVKSVKKETREADKSDEKADAAVKKAEQAEKRAERAEEKADRAIAKAEKSGKPADINISQNLSVAAEKAEKESDEADKEAIKEIKSDIKEEREESRAERKLEKEQAASDVRLGEKPKDLDDPRILPPDEFRKLRGRKRDLEKLKAKGVPGAADELERVNKRLDESSKALRAKKDAERREDLEERNVPSKVVSEQLKIDNTLDSVSEQSPEAKKLVKELRSSAVESDKKASAFLDSFGSSVADGTVTKKEVDIIKRVREDYRDNVKGIISQIENAKNLPGITPEQKAVFNEMEKNLEERAKLLESRELFDKRDNLNDAQLKKIFTEL